jgi:hypothetical protein
MEKFNNRLLTIVASRRSQSLSVGQKMKMKQVLGILACLALVIGCNREESRDFFGDITLGPPAWTNGYCFLTAKFPTKIQHSGQWLYKVTAKVDGRDIILTAHITTRLKTAFSGNVNVGTPAPGSYGVFLRDPDGNKHLIGTTEIGPPNQASEATSEPAPGAASSSPQG